MHVSPPILDQGHSNHPCLVARGYPGVGLSELARVESGAAVFFWLIMRHETLRPHEPHAFPPKGRGTTGEHARGGCLEDCGLRRKGMALSFRQEGQREGMRRAIPLLCPTLAPP